jgi:histidyl-tRNA synthetase
VNGIPFSIILGEDELAQGKIKIKENGLPADNPDKDGITIEKANLVSEVKSRLQSKAEKQDSLANGVGNLTV